MPLYRYKPLAEDPSHTCEQGEEVEDHCCGHYCCGPPYCNCIYNAEDCQACCDQCGLGGFEVRQELSDAPITNCPSCGQGVRRVIQPVATVVRHGMKNMMYDYRDDLARFPGDKEAYVDGPRSVQKLMDKRKREGWTFGKIADAAPETPKFRSSEDVAREAYKRAEAKGFTPSDD